MSDIDPGRFEIHRASVRDGVELAYVREGVGGYPLLLVHGWPETMRIWWRNIEPLAEAGFDVRAWNRTRGKAEQDGVEVFDSPAQASEGAEIVLTMLADTDAVLDAARDALRDDTLWLQMSTIGIEGTEQAAGLAGERGLEDSNEGRVLRGIAASIGGEGSPDEFVARQR